MHARSIIKANISLQSLSKQILIYNITIIFIIIILLLLYYYNLYKILL